VRVDLGGSGTATAGASRREGMVENRIGLQGLTSRGTFRNDEGVRLHGVGQGQHGFLLAASTMRTADRDMDHGPRLPSAQGWSTVVLRCGALGAGLTCPNT